MKKLVGFLIMSGLLLAQAWGLETQPTSATAPSNSTPAATAPANSAANGQANTTETRPQHSPAQRRSYERETGRRHQGISKKEMIVLGAVVGSSMGIGALAGGAHGLAIGTIVGGWGAFAGHYIWKKLH